MKFRVVLRTDRILQDVLASPVINGLIGSRFALVSSYFSCLDSLGCRIYSRCVVLFLGSLACAQRLYRCP